MRNIALIMIMVAAGLATAARAEMGSWKAYMAYYDVQQIRAAGNYLFVLASNNLYQYNTNDKSITTYDKVSGLSDTYITNIAWCRAARRLVAVYENSNIDLVETDGDVTNIADLYMKTMTDDKTVNSITVSGTYAYLATNFGVVKVNVAAAEISETYNLGLAVSRVGLDGGSIYVRTSAGAVWTAALTDNLIDKGNWQQAASYPDGVFDEDNSDYDTYYDEVASLNPGGPRYNMFGYLKFHNGKLYTANGYSSLVEEEACLQVYDGSDWTIYETDITDEIGHRFVNLATIDIDPTDESHVFAGGQTGLYEYRDGKFVQEYTVDNSPLQVAATVSANTGLTQAQMKCYVLVLGIKFDDDGNLWVANSISPTTSLLKLTPGGVWESYHSDELMLSSQGYSMEGMTDMMFDSRGLLWFGNNYWRTPALIRCDTDDGEVAAYSDDIVNQDGTSLVLTYVKDIVEDRDGDLWFATNEGPLYITPSQIATGSYIHEFYQFKVPRNDGTSYADYLLNDVEISAIAIDGANRKWFGTSSNGVYLISADNMTQLEHFTADNSKLLSDNVLDIAIDGTTGEVFFGTELGLCSYMSDATTPADEMDKSNVYAYPNPVRPGYTGLITVTGLTYDADVKITTATGYLVAEGRSNGGTFTWDGCDTRGRRVASGVYNVVTATSDGGKGTVCKIAIVN